MSAPAAQCGRTTDPAAWLICFADGAHRTVMLDGARALQYAAACRGTIEPLYTRAQIRDMLPTQVVVRGAEHGGA